MPNRSICSIMVARVYVVCINDVYTMCITAAAADDDAVWLVSCWCMCVYVYNCVCVYISVCK